MQQGQSRVYKRVAFADWGNFPGIGLFAEAIQVTADCGVSTADSMSDGVHPLRIDGSPGLAGYSQRPTDDVSSSAGETVNGYCRWHVISCKLYEVSSQQPMGTQGWPSWREQGAGTGESEPKSREERVGKSRSR